MQAERTNPLWYLCVSGRDFRAQVLPADKLMLSNRILGI